MSLPQLLVKAASRAGCDGVLLSGGLDSTTVAWALRRAGLRPVAFNTQYAPSPGADVPYLLEAARAFGLTVVLSWATEDDALRAVDEVVGILKVFNPMEVVNCAAAYISMRAAVELGVRRICTGDGGDELFAGYGYMISMRPEELEQYIKRLTKRWHFCAFDVGKALGLEVHAPYLDPEVVDYALSVPASEKVRDGVGKYVVRRQFEGILPAEIVWRRKDPLEVGSGFKALYDVLAKLSEGAEADVPVSGAAKYLYRLFKRRGLAYEKDRENPCPVCGYRLEGGYCRMCGYYR
ncbi:MAG: asparagine synthase C-terminal domain-containing protein [Thermoproteus sp.]|nr:asparagine synthase C-terminal domain-containing protein [Thermoproteus sp.]